MKGIGKVFFILLGGLLLLPSMCIPALAVSFLASIRTMGFADMVYILVMMGLLVLGCIVGVGLIRRALRPEQPKGPPQP